MGASHGHLSRQGGSGASTGSAGEPGGADRGQALRTATLSPEGQQRGGVRVIKTGPRPVPGYPRESRREPAGHGSRGSGQCRRRASPGKTHAGANPGECPWQSSSCPRSGSRGSARRDRRERARPQPTAAGARAHRARRGACPSAQAPPPRVPVSLGSHGAPRAAWILNRAANGERPRAVTAPAPPLNRGRTERAAQLSPARRGTGTAHPAPAQLQPPAAAPAQAPDTRSCTSTGTSHPLPHRYRDP